MRFPPSTQMSDSELCQGSCFADRGFGEPFPASGALDELT